MQFLRNMEKHLATFFTHERDGERVANVWKIVCLILLVCLLLVVFIRGGSGGATTRETIKEFHHVLPAERPPEAPRVPKPVSQAPAQDSRADRRIEQLQQQLSELRRELAAPRHFGPRPVTTERPSDQDNVPQAPDPFAGLQRPTFKAPPPEPPPAREPQARPAPKVTFVACPTQCDTSPPAVARNAARPATISSSRITFLRDLALHELAMARARSEQMALRLEALPTGSSWASRAREASLAADLHAQALANLASLPAYLDHSLAWSSELTVYRARLAAKAINRTLAQLDGVVGRLTYATTSDDLQSSRPDRVDTVRLPSGSILIAPKGKGLGF
jgi:hypothetical protein